MMAVAPLTPEQAEALNPGVRRLVPFLRAHGFETCDSGDGVTHQATCDRDYPYVVCAIANPAHLADEAHRLVDVLRVAGIEIRALDATLDMQANVQAYYSPIDGFAHVEVTGVTDAQLPAEASR